MLKRARRVAMVMKGSPMPAIKTPGNANIGLRLYNAGSDSGGNVNNNPVKMQSAPMPIAVNWLMILLCRIKPTLVLPIAMPTETSVSTDPPYDIDFWNCSFR